MAHTRDRFGRQWRKHLWLIPLAALLACDGGTRGSGISGASVVSGSIAGGDLDAGLSAATLAVAEISPVVVQIREAPEINAVVDPITHNFTLTDVPPGDVTIEFFGSTTASIALRGLPENIELRMVNVRFAGDRARPAGFAVIPREGNAANVVASRRKGPAPLRVTFGVSDLSVSDAARVVWSFGDGTRSGQGSVSHAYAEPGNYVVQARVSGANGDQRALHVIEVLAPGDRSLQVTASANPMRGLPPLSVVFTATVENSVGGTSFEWHFGDDTAPGQGRSVRHTFTREGIFLVQVTARDEANNEESDVVQIEVNSGTRPIPLEVTASVDRPVGAAPHTVQFSATIKGSGPISIEWDFDDGTAPTSAPTPMHTYTEAGIYFARITVTELESGETDFDEVVIEVR